MSDETTAKNHHANVRSQDQARKPAMPPEAGPHSPGSVEPKKAVPESGGYERHPADHSTSNAKGGYGAG